MDIRQAIETTKNLNPNDKALLAHCLIASLETSNDSGVDNAWGDLAEKRYTEIMSGTVETVSWENYTHMLCCFTGEKEKRGRSLKA